MKSPQDSLYSSERRLYEEIPHIELPVLRLEVAARDKVLVFDPNGLLAAIMSGDFDARQMEPAEYWPSIISGHPGLQYRCRDMVIELSPTEMDRFLRHDLNPEEYQAIRLRYPWQPEDYFDIHDDFYDPGTGEALQPLER